MTPGPLAGLVALALLASSGSAAADPMKKPVQATPELVAGFLADPEAFFFDLRYLETIACAEAVLKDVNAAPGSRSAAYRALGQVYAALDAPAQAGEAFHRLFEIDPGADLDPPAAYPPVVVKAFYATRDRFRQGKGLDAPPASPGIHTLAVGPMDNASPKLPGQTMDMDRFAAGLTQMVVTDLMPATSLRIVDRQRLNVLRSEIQLSNSGFADPAQAVKAGRLLGAQSYLFGSVTRIPGDVVRIDLRLVETETSRVLLAAKKEGRIRNGSDLLKLEKDVVDLLARELDRRAQEAGAPAGSVSRRAGQGLDARRKQSAEALTLLDLTGAAILAEDAGKMDEALSLWNQVAGIDSKNELAMARVKALELEQRYASLEWSKP